MADERIDFCSMERSGVVVLDQHLAVVGKNQKKENGGCGGGNKKGEALTVVMKVDFHCQGCEAKIYDAARKFPGVHFVDKDKDKKKLTVTGKVDPVQLHKKLEKSTNKKIELVSPQPKKNDKKPEETKKKELPVITAVFKMYLHCDACCSRIRHIIQKIKGVQTVEIDEKKELVTVRGAVDPKTVPPVLYKKMKRVMELVPQKKENKRDHEKKQENCDGGNQNHQQQQQQLNKSCSTEANKMLEILMKEYYGCPNKPGYVVDRIYAPQCFSDENPNACSIL